MELLNPTARESTSQAALVAEVVATNDNSRHLVPAKLSFSFEDARDHLIRVDPRFEGIFNRLPCRPFEHLEQFDPFITLATSILGQQISWKAARSITHKFVKLFNADVPETPGEYKLTRISDYFPTAQQVAKMDHASLRTAGLSGRKAEYVLDLATRFTKGELTTEKLLKANDDELYDMLTAVRGIGKWTVDMFAIFSLRRPDILPIGDLGVQRGVARWFLSLHAPDYGLVISPEKLPKGSEEETTNTTTVAQASASAEEVEVDEDTLPVLGQVAAPSKKSNGKGKKSASSKDSQLDPLPTPFTPSVNKILNARSYSSGESYEPPPLPRGLTVSMLRGRLMARKKMKGVYLTAIEIEDLTEIWRPYRSLGVYYMWALAEEV
ncbi:hypothetical protein NLI96_g5449 [Meripilus lineatus]|uniref:HhH-GPD domain-containing protein n=1 Tax=Meripilus lineatus TaxID=2056292 RepID=A0AAD5V2Z0_9APHY|nr:hypothetical protein NLI96_g5449 [Physisporinus lineatus]